MVLMGFCDLMQKSQYFGHLVGNFDISLNVGKVCCNADSIDYLT